VTHAHTDDLELARRCAAGDEDAWRRFVLEYRPVLYRAADALDPTGGARELADALYADLYGLSDEESTRRSLFRYFQGRSSLATWLRAVLAQRYVDRLRAQRRLVPLPDEDGGTDGPAASRAHEAAGVAPSNPDRPRHLALLRQALSCAIARLNDRDRLRLGLYYVHELTLAHIGRALKEHEATASRNLARTRRTIRGDVERQLRDETGMNDAQVAECIASVAEDAGSIDLTEILGTPAAERK
jgi:RNA polymerase sigma factor (sigma-70 family)